MTDLLSIVTSRISVAAIAKSRFVVVPHSGLVLRCLSKLYSLGYIASFKILDVGNISVALKFVENKPVLRRIIRVSTPGNRKYATIKQLKKTPATRIQGFLLVSTNKGVLTEQECFFNNIGGEILLLVS